MHLLPTLLATSLAIAALTTTNPAPPPNLLLSESFDDTNLLKRNWYDGDTFRIIPPPNAKAGTGCIEYEWPDLTSTVKGSSVIRHLFTSTDELYIRFYLRLSKDFGWTNKGYHPHLINLLTTENDKFMGPAATHLTLYVEPVDGKLRLAATDIQNKDAPHGLTQGELKGGFNGKTYDSKNTLFQDDQWHLIEAHFKLNTLKADQPNPDGIAQAWFDGTLVIEKNDLILRSTDFPNMKLNQFLLAPYFGPGLLPKPQKLWIDELALSAQRLPPPARSPANE